MREAWAPPSMEGSWRLRLSFICDDCSCFEEGTLEEEGACLAGTSSTWTITDLSVSMKRQHTRASLSARDSSSKLRGSRAHCSSG